MGVAKMANRAPLFSVPARITGGLKSTPRARPAGIDGGQESFSCIFCVFFFFSFEGRMKELVLRESIPDIMPRTRRSLPACG